jgi:predicted Fe-Mo cluster-binding NifX family protein
MKICMPTIDDRGPDGLPSAHFGASPFFTLFDLDTGEWQALGNTMGGHEHGACRPLDTLAGHTVDAVLCRDWAPAPLPGFARPGSRCISPTSPRWPPAWRPFGRGASDSLPRPRSAMAIVTGPEATTIP